MPGGKEDDLASGGSLTKKILDLRVDGMDLGIAAAHRGGELDPIVFLHGFGSTKEDYLDIVQWPDFAERPFLAYDAPGCGETCCADPSRVSVPFLVETARAVLERARIRRFHLVGHSMGGLTALLLAHQEPERVLSFVDIEGNLAPEDCFLSRQIISHPAVGAGEFFDDFVERVWRSSGYSSALYAASLRHKVRVGAVRGIFESMVELSDHGDLMRKFLSLRCLRMFMYGEQNAVLSYLGKLRAHGVELAEIPHSGHFPMYANPVAMWKQIAEFLKRASE